MEKPRVLALLASVGLLAAACGGGAQQSPAGGQTGSPAQAEPVRLAIVLPCPVNDLSWCQQAYTAVKKLESEGEVELKYIENGPTDASAAEQVFAEFANQGFDLIIGDSTTYIDPVKKVAAQFPDLAFAASNSPDTTENFATYQTPLYQGAYLAGILAAGITKTGTIGVIAAFDIPVCHSTAEAYRMGAQEVDPDIKVLTTYTGDFNDPTPNKEATLAQADQGADVFVSCGGGPATGMALAVKERNLSGFGYIGDMSSLAPQNIVGSLVWDKYKVFRPMVEDVRNGTFQPAKTYHSGIPEGGMQVELNPEYSATTIPQDVLDRMEQEQKRIESGAFEVPYIPE